MLLLLFFCAAVCLSIFLGRAVFNASECFGEVAHFLEAAQGADFGDFQVGGDQEGGGLLDAELAQILDGGRAEHGAEAAEAFAFADGGAGGDLGAGDFPGVVLVDVV